MNKTIKILSFALLLSATTILSMKNNAISPTYPCPLAKLPNEIVKIIFKHSCSNKEVMIGRFRSICRDWLTLFNPIAIRTILQLDPANVLTEIAGDLSNNNKSNYHYIKFLADMLQDQPDSYNEIISFIIQKSYYNNFTQALERCANPSYSDFLYKEPSYNSKIQVFKLCLQDDDDVYQDSGNGQTIMDVALTDARYDHYQMIRTILETKGHFHPDYPKYLTLEKQKKIVFLICLVGMIAIFFSQYTLF